MAEEERQERHVGPPEQAHGEERVVVGRLMDEAGHLWGGEADEGNRAAERRDHRAEGPPP